MTMGATSPASSGPAGSHFEGQIGAHYLLSMLANAEPRGLPGTILDRVELQRAPEGHPLDDVIIQAHDMHGDAAVLEIQVKRSISFSPSDSVFQAVVAQMVEASRRPEFFESRYELAVATARTNRKVQGAYQDVLTWARYLGSEATFFSRFEKNGSASDDMRTFVNTFKSNLRKAGGSDDDETVWKLLRKFQILVFDFTAQHSSYEEFANERAVRVLHRTEASKARSLWSSLINIALEVALNGGDRNRDDLVGELGRQSFRLEGDSRLSYSRSVLAEDSQYALADIGDQVGNVMLSRYDHVSAVRAALDEGRYIEIRGDAGVGKSGVMKHFAQQIAAESLVIVLDQYRTIPKGWTAMRAVLGFEGTCREFLSDIASDGGGVLFIDGIDFFDEEERRTIVDIVREAVNVPGFSIICTARRHFGVDDPNWLPADALDQLGRATPVVVGELTEEEIEELKNAAPRLAALLHGDHPARDVTRNLFRLARLARQPESETILRTEIDMAEQWWRTADGERDDNHRERARLLRALAEQALSQAGPIHVSNNPATAVDALVNSETLRDLGNDLVKFYHDVLREWAIANLLYSKPDIVADLPLDRPATAQLARGVELAARMTLERGSDSERWQSLLELVSGENIHGSWRRSVLLALVRSEVSFDLLNLVSSLLFTNRASLLRELIRTTMAVEVVPASDIFEAADIDVTLIPTSMNIPSGPFMCRLVRWLLSLDDSLPTAALPEVVDLYVAWSTGMFGLDPLTPELLVYLFSWLTEIESAGDAESIVDRREPFGGELDSDHISRLEDNLRTGFLLFCNRTPELATKYLNSLKHRRGSDNAVRGILTFRGSLAQAAPAELAELTAATLISKQSSGERPHRRRDFEEPFEYVDHEFLPASPAQGPFYELLTYAPEHGFLLIRQLIDHAISSYSNDQPYGSDAIIIPFPDGDRAFPWEQTYSWSRVGVGHNCITSALMALESWAHKQIEAGEPFDKVLADVIGQPGTPAAYLLVAVDLVLSHWPESHEIAVPFLACPELLCLDRERLVHENFSSLDVMRFKALYKEPMGAVSLDDLRKRSSRRFSLEQVIGQYAVYDPAKLREVLADLLRVAAARLGPYGEQSRFSDPAFMVAHALNLVDPENWQAESEELSDGTQSTNIQYVPPRTESQHLQQLQEATPDDVSDINMLATITLATEDLSRSSPEIAVAGVDWARRKIASQIDTDTDEGLMDWQAVVAAAMIAMRDGEVELRTQHEDWARSIFARALRTKDDLIHRMRSGLLHNPTAIAFVGMVYLLKERTDPEDLGALLEVAASGSPAGAHGFRHTAGVLATIDERLPRALLRCAFAACVRPIIVWDLPEEQKKERIDQERQRVKSVENAEMDWLAGERSEPDWPTFPLKPARPRRRLQLKGHRRQPEELGPQRTQEDAFVDHQGAALWITNMLTIIDIGKRPWLRDIVCVYGPWTAAANGASLEAGEDPADSPIEWNNAYFDLLAYCLPGLQSSEVDELALTPIISLPDQAFFDAVTQFLRSIDAVYFENNALEELVAVRIRSELAHRLMESGGWRRLQSDRSQSIETHIGPAIAAFFLNYYGYTQPPICYLDPNKIDRLESFISVLDELIQSGPCLFVALVTLNLFEASPRPAHLPVIVRTANIWLASYPDDSTFWIDQLIGRRVCDLIDGIRLQDQTLLNSENALRRDVDAILPELIRLGVVEASRLEAALIGR